MNQTKRVLHIIPYMHPAGGGPPVVADRFCQGLAERGWRVELLTTDALQVGDDASWRDELGQGYQLRIEPSWGRRVFGFSPAFRRAARQLIAKTDLVHLHNLWSYANWFAIAESRRLGKPVLVNTHGMLDPNSMARKASRKRLYGRFLECPNLRRATGLVFTHPEEERLARSVWAGLPPGWIVPLGADRPPEDLSRVGELFLQRFPQLRDRKRVVFLSRLHEKKGLDLLLPAMRKVANESPQSTLVLVGGGDDLYVNQLKSLADDLQLAEHIVWCGPLSGDLKWGAPAQRRRLRAAVLSRELRARRCRGNERWDACCPQPTRESLGGCRQRKRWVGV